jgi:SAM-dependent methyltransferase
MNCFQLIKSVLDELYRVIPGKEPAKDDAIRKRLDLFTRKQYPNLRKGVEIDYRDAVSRFAYIYRYTTSHANIVCSLIRGDDTLRALFKQPSLTVACVGGGPGSDFLGILKYLDGCKNKPHIKCHLIDREKSWNNCWSDVDAKLDSAGFRLSTHFVPIDVTDPTSYDPLEDKYLNADVFTFVYFMSELYAKRAKAQAYFENLFTRVKPGASIFYVDNGSDEFTKWFDGFVDKKRFKLEGPDSANCQMPPDEEKKDLGEYFDKFGPVKLGANIAYRIAVRRKK